MALRGQPVRVCLGEHGWGGVTSHLAYELVQRDNISRGGCCKDMLVLVLLT